MKLGPRILTFSHSCRISSFLKYVIHLFKIPKLMVIAKGLIRGEETRAAAELNGSSLTGIFKTQSSRKDPMKNFQNGM